MNILITGQNGMLGSCLSKTLSEHHTIIKPDARIDITDIGTLRKKISVLGRLDYIVNCAAVTDTNYCNTNEGMKDSFNVNCLGVKNLAEICREFDIHLIHVSTDYVHSEYSTKDNDEFPVNVYGLHKLLGEKYIVETIKDITKYSIIRCSWLYGMTDRKKNFVDKIVEFANNSKNGTIKVVNDCFGRPSSVEYVSEFISKCIEYGQYGIIDGQINSKPISRYDFSKMIIGNMNLGVEVVPVDSNFFPTVINQPKNMPETITDESMKFGEITSSIDHSDDYEYWLKRYTKERYQ